MPVVVVSRRSCIHVEADLHGCGSRDRDRGRVGVVHSVEKSRGAVGSADGPAVVGRPR
ncbi:hypothetical protein ACFPRL_17830 [Pseudoclavibacter helvolus]